MKITYLILLTSEVYLLIVECALTPDINLEGRLIENNDSNVLQLICSTNIAVQLCTVEFLIDKKTHDNIRYHDDNCYQTMRICSPTLCKCSGDCKSFTLNVTVTQGMMNYIYSCASRIESKGVTYSANISIINQDGNWGSTIYKKIVVPSNIVSPPSQQTPTPFPEIRSVASFSAQQIVGILFGLFSLIASIIAMFFFYGGRYCPTCFTKSERKRSSSPIHDLGESAGFRQPMTSHNTQRRWKQSSSTQTCLDKQDTVMDSGNKEKRLTISTISTNSGSVHSLADIIFLPTDIPILNRQ